LRTAYSLILASLIANGSVLTSYAGDLGSISGISSGFYAGIGGGWNTIDERFNSTLFTSTFKGALDNYDTSRNRLSPTIQLGYWAPFNTKWLWGVAAQWEYLHYKTVNVNTTHGQSLPNATFSSINIFGPDVMRDFSSQTKADNVVNFLFYGGEQFSRSYVYFGIGPALFKAANKVFVSSVHVGGGDTLISTLVNANKTLFGGAAQVGYNYYINSSYFLNFSYTYSQSKTYNLTNSVNAALLNGAISPDSVTVNINRTINLMDQHAMVSINRVWG
jgi:hypothetical protein